MSTPAWILEIFAAVMLLVAEVSAGQLVMAHAWTRRVGADDIAVSRLLTGIAVAGILVPGLSILPNAAWEIVFAVMTAWFAWRLWRESQGRGAAAVARSQYAPHLVQSAAMLYLFAALAGPPVEGSGTSCPARPGCRDGGRVVRRHAGPPVRRHWRCSSRCCWSRSRSMTWTDGPTWTATSTRRAARSYPQGPRGTPLDRRT